MIQLYEVDYIGGPLDGDTEAPALMPKDAPPIHFDTFSGKYQHEWRCVKADYDYGEYRPTEGDVIVHRFRYVYAGVFKK